LSDYKAKSVVAMFSLVRGSLEMAASVVCI